MDGDNSWKNYYIVSSNYMNKYLEEVFILKSFIYLKNKQSKYFKVEIQYHKKLLQVRFDVVFNKFDFFPTPIEEKEFLLSKNELEKYFLLK